MSLLTNATQANPTSFYFAVAGGGGGGGTLQSPASVTPDGTGTATLSVNANLAGGSAAISALGGANSTGVITVGGEGTTYRMGVLAPSAQLAPSLPQLQIGLNAAVAPAITYDGGNHTLILGDGNAASVVQTGGAFAVYDANGGSTNALAMSPATSTASFITQTCASGGTVVIGSSSAYTDILEVKDVGFKSFVYVGGNGGNKLYIAAESSNITTIGTNAIEFTNGNLQLQASQAATNTVNITDTNMTVDQILTLVQPPVLTTGAATILAPGTHGGGVNATINVSTYADGLWLFITKPSVTTDQTTYNAMVSGTILISGGKVTGGGYIGIAGGGNASVQTQVVVPGDTFNVINSTGNNLYYGAYLQQLTGPFPGL